MKKTQTYVEFFMPGLIAAERAVEKVSDRSDPKVIPPGTYAYWFFDRIEGELDGESVVGAPKNYSKFTYFGKTIPAAVFKNTSRCSPALKKHIEDNKIQMLVETKSGKVFPFAEGDKARDEK